MKRLEEEENMLLTLSRPVVKYEIIEGNISSQKRISSNKRNREECRRENKERIENMK